MSLYLLLYSGGGMPETEDATRAMTQAWASWLTKVGDALADGNPFTSEARTVSPDGSVSDGPVGPMASGYSLIRAGAMDEIIAIAKDCPAKQSGASISIFEVR
jgi:hypothetical protein